jgi:LmbE family N-acetylglucosaminyl deacetylase
MKKNTAFILIAIFMTVSMFALLSIFTLPWYLGLIFIAIIYAVHAVFFTDHIYYNPKSDYQFTFSKAINFSGAIKNNQFSLSDKLPDNIDTCILPISIKSNLSGFLVDPYIEIIADGVTSRQYFERGVNGIRYVNLSRLISHLQKDKKLQISGKHCKVNSCELDLLGFENQDYQSKRLLIISPHADDAELAAFAFYKHSQSVLITTISAGEVDARPYELLSGKGNKAAAGLLKGRLRAWDSVAIPLWAGKHVESIHLGYFCMTLKAMFERKSEAVKSHSTGEKDIRSFRRFNKMELPGDQQGDNSWPNLISDLTAIIRDFKPDIILTPHPTIDPQPDHLYSTRAVVEACESENITPQFLLYANHYHHTDMYPFGLEHSDLPLPPHFQNSPIAEKLFSFPLNRSDEIDKVCSLKMMHDLNRPTSLKRKSRRILQRIVGRSKMPYGDDEYLRKAIRQQELFWVTSFEQLKKEFNAE